MLVLLVAQEEKYDEEIEEPWEEICSSKFNSDINVICGIEVAHYKLEKYFFKAEDYLLLQFYENGWESRNKFFLLCLADRNQPSYLVVLRM